MKKPEEKLHFAVADYIKLAYPKVFFISESSGVRTSIGLATKLKRTRSSHVHLDLYLLHPKNGKAGLILELKAKPVKKKNGELFKSDHLADQQDTINKLNKLGYVASFATSFKEAKDLIDNYLNGKN